MSIFLNASSFNQDCCPMIMQTEAPVPGAPVGSMLPMAGHGPLQDVTKRRISRTKYLPSLKKQQSGVITARKASNFLSAVSFSPSSWLGYQCLDLLNRPEQQGRGCASYLWNSQEEQPLLHHGKTAEENKGDWVILWPLNSNYHTRPRAHSQALQTHLLLFFSGFEALVCLHCM